MRRENRLLKEDIKLLEYRIKLLDPKGILEKQKEKDVQDRQSLSQATDPQHLIRENFRLNEELKFNLEKIESLKLENK